MSVDGGSHTDTGRRNYTLSRHVRQRLKYDDEDRAIDREVINEAVLYGETVDSRNGGNEVEVHHTVAGITFKVVLNEVNKVVASAYPIEFSRFDAVTSNRWTRSQIEGIEERIEEGKTKEV